MLFENALRKVHTTLALRRVGVALYVCVFNTAVLVALSLLSGRRVGALGTAQWLFAATTAAGIHCLGCCFAQTPDDSERLTGRRLFRTAGFVLATATASTLLSIAFVSLWRGSFRLTIPTLVTSTGQQVSCISQSSFSSIFSAAVLGLLLGLHLIYDRVTILRFPSLNQKRLARIRDATSTVLTSAMGEGLLASVVVVPACMASGAAACSALDVFMCGQCAWPTTETRVSLFVQLSVASFVTLLVLRFATAVWFITETERIEFSEVTIDGNESPMLLLSAMHADTESQRTAKYSGFYDLSFVAGIDSDRECRRRAAFFADTSRSTWMDLATLCLETINSLTGRMRDTAAMLSQIGAPSLSLQQQFRPRQFHFIPTTLLQVFDAIFLSMRLLVHGHLRESLAALTPTPAIRPEMAMFAPPARIIGPQPAVVLPDLQLCIWAIQAISRLVALSKSEDRFGVVQSTNSIASTLGTLVECIVAAEDLQHTLTPGNRMPSFDKASSFVDYRLAILHDACTTAIYQITGTFGSSMVNVQLPTRYRQVLQSFRTWTR